MNDLEYAARNIHVWPTEPKVGIIIGRRPFSGGNASYIRVGRGDLISEEIYKDQWLAERARLQNKPKPCDWPVWAEYMAQCSDGEWRWFDRAPKAGISVWPPSGRWIWGNRGEVLGDWRDTLEKKPEKFRLTGSESIPKHINCRCVMTRVKQEWDGEGLPPVGSEVKVRHNDNEWYVVKVLAHDDNYIVFRNYKDYPRYNSAIGSGIRPLRTEEEKSISEIENIIYDVWDQGDEEASTIAKAIYERWVKNQDSAE